MGPESKLTNLPDHATEYESRLELPAPSVSVLEICDPLISESELSSDPSSFKSLQLSTSQPEVSVSMKVYICSIHADITYACNYGMDFEFGYSGGILASFPCPTPRTGERAWFQPFAHALNRSRIPRRPHTIDILLYTCDVLHCS